MSTEARECARDPSRSARARIALGADSDYGVSDVARDLPGPHRDEHAPEVSERSRYPGDLPAVSETVLKPSWATVRGEEARGSSATTEGALCEFS